MLPPETQRVWERLQSEPLLAGFVLVGGTALTLRLSEDLDFLFVGSRLPAARLQQLRLALAAEGLQLERNDDPKAADEFEIAGMSLHDYQQDFVAAGDVKLSFFTPDTEALAVMRSTRPDGPRLAELAEIFALKSLLTASRSRTRDWFDLWVLMTQHGFTMKDLRDVFGTAESQREIAMRRLHSGTVPLHDPGYAALVTPHPAPSPDQLRAFFRTAVEAEEIRVAQAVAKESDDPTQRIGL